MDAGSEPTVSVVIGSNAPPESLAACLEALEPQRDGVEVLVQEGRPSPAELRDRFPWADFAFAPAQLVPEHWRDGIDRASGEIVALTIAPMIPAPDWIATIRELGGRYEAFAGAIEPGADLRLVDWAEYFCRYARDMPPFRGPRERRPSRRQRRLRPGAARDRARGLPRRVLGTGGAPSALGRRGRALAGARARGRPRTLHRLRRVRAASASSTGGATGASVARTARRVTIWCGC